MSRDPWSTPTHATTTPLSKEELRVLRELGGRLRPLVRVGRESAWEVTVAKTNAHLAGDELVKVEFVKVPPKELRSKADALATATLATLVEVKGAMAVLYRRRPDSSLEALRKRLA